MSDSIITIRYKTLYVEASREDWELAFQLVEAKIKRERENEGQK